MKKYFPLTIVLGVLFASCSNEDIEIIDSADLSLNISTQSVYDDFNMADAFKSRFIGGKGYSIGVFSYIYDKNGSLSASDSTFVDTFGKITQNFSNLKAGDYTLVTLEMLVENDNNYSSPNWVIAGQDNLETLQILNKEYTTYWYTAIGVKTESFTLPKGGISKEILPKGIGVVIETNMTNFNNSDYLCVNFFTKDMPKGRYLSPNYEGEERFIYDSYTESNVWTPRVYTYTDELPAYVGLDAYLLEEGTVRYCFGAQKIGSDGKLENTFHPCPNNNSFFTVNDGMTYYGGYHYIGGDPGYDCQAAMFNTYTEYDSWYKQLISNYSTAYTKPCLQWGTNATVVNNYMNSNNMALTDSGSDEASNKYWTYYINSSATVGYEYNFDYNQSNLNAVFMNFDTDYYTVQSLKSDLSQSYQGGEYSSELGGYFFMSDQTLLLLSNDTSNGYITILYIPNDSSSSSVRKLKSHKSSFASFVPNHKTNRSSFTTSELKFKINKLSEVDSLK